MAASFPSELRPFLLVNVRPTGRIIGEGSYGSVEEVEIPGAKCAAKKIHDFFQDPTRMPAEGIQKASREFVRVSTDEHPSPPAHRPVSGSLLFAGFSNACASHGATAD